MNKILVLLLLLCGLSFAQPPAAIPTGLTGVNYQNAVNAWMTYLNTGKVATTRTVNGQALSSNIVLDTSLIGESGNLYFTNARARGALSATSPITYDASTGVIACPSCGTSTGVPSVFGRTGNVLAQSGDYSSFYSAVGHTHAASDIVSGTLAFGLMPTGTSSSTVAVGNHNHSGVYAAISHTHIIADITGLQAALDAKQAVISGAPGTWPSTFAPSAHATSHKLTGSDPIPQGCSLASSLGFLLNGSDESTLLNSTLAAFYTANGGCLYIDNNKTLRADSQIKFPDSGADPWASPTYRITGSGGMSGNGDSSQVIGGSTLDLRYHGSGITLYQGGPKLWASGMGILEIDHITVADMSTDCGAFLLTTGTKLFVHHATFYSAVTEGSACADAIILGGTANYPRTGAITDPFFGYGSVIEHNTFTRMARWAYFGGNVNQINFSKNLGWGGNTTTPGPIIESVAGGSGTNFGNNIRDNTFEGCNRNSGIGSCVPSYNCGLKLAAAQEWNIDGNGMYDTFSAGSSLLCGGSTAIRNNVTRTNYVDTTTSLLVAPGWDENNYMPWRTVPFYFDGGGSALSGSVTRCGLVPFGGIINRFSLFSDVSGNATITVKALAAGSYTGQSSVSTTIGTETMTGAAKLQDTTLSGWSYTSVAGVATMPPNTVLCFTLSSPATVSWVAGNIQIWEGR